MFLTDIFRQLSYGEIASYFIGSELDTERGAQYWPQLIDHINQALTVLHVKFPLKEDQVNIQQYRHITTYKLDSNYAETNEDSIEKYKYIKDSKFKPFQDNVLRIQTIYSEDYEELPINDQNHCRSIYTPTYNSIMVPTPHDENALLVIYRGNHKKLDPETVEPSMVEIDIPNFLEEALLSYVGHRYLASKNTETTSNLSSRYYGKFISICNEVEEKNLILQSHGGVNIHPCIQGWV